ncbi:hypothetical protein O3M35_004795 [Rhynocoris fuscipes]|uniref:Uncharacterized protein n=1 Tax=Rhynocoris fuscipes TaxID=488301 RepID=A0AAW1DN42_9HEMI
MGFSNATNGQPPSVFTTVKIREHETVFLPCYSGNLGTNSVRWWHENELLTDAGEILSDSVNYRIHSNNTLEVIDVIEQLSGTYICQVKRPPPMTPIRHNYIIQVLYPPKVWMYPDELEVPIELHQDVTLYCNATGFPQPFITWTFNGDEITEMRNQNTLSFIVTKENSGDYVCIASNGVGNSDMKSVLVLAVYPPTVSADKLWIHTSPGLRTVIECIVDGSPTPKVEWYMNNRMMQKDPRFTFYRKANRYGIIIKASRLSDIGHYTCMASNKLGRNKIPIEVSALPNIAVFKTIQDKFEDKAILVWEVESYSPIIQYHLLFRKFKIGEKSSDWTKLTIPADDSGGAPIQTKNFTLTGLERATQYEAYVISKNIYGRSKPSNLYRFSTIGFTVTTDMITTESGTEEINTITDFLSDYPTDYGNEIIASGHSEANQIIQTPIFGGLIMLLVFPILEL